MFRRKYGNMGTKSNPSGVEAAFEVRDRFRHSTRVVYLWFSVASTASTSLCLAMEMVSAPLTRRRLRFAENVALSKKTGLNLIAVQSVNRKLQT